MRTVEDPRFVACMVFQGELASATGEVSEARRLFELAGDGALANGDVYDAGIAYVKAAEVARRQQNLADATRLVDKVAPLTGSPLLSERERHHLLGWLPDSAIG